MNASFFLLLAAALAVTFALPRSLPAEKRPGAWRGQSLTEFTPEENDRLGWQIVNDGVMGGLSRGNLEFTGDGNMRFSGDLSLENNGGFSYARSGDVDFNLSNDLGLLLLVKGDGRTYEARLESDARYRGRPVSFSGKLATARGEWRQVKIPFASFEGSWRGTDLPDAALDPSLIERVGIILADKNAGAFELEVAWIRTYGKGQGEYTERRAGAAPPAAPASLIDTASADGRFTILKKALDAAGLTVFFQWDNPLTVFAPTDAAFAKLPEETLAELLDPANKEKLVAILSYHVSPGSTALADALATREVETVQGSPLAVSFSNGRVRVNDALLLDGDVECADGIIHVIDTVLLPPGTGGKAVAARR